MFASVPRPRRTNRRGSSRVSSACSRCVIVKRSLATVVMWRNSASARIGGNLPNGDDDDLVPASDRDSLEILAPRRAIVGAGNGRESRGPIFGGLEALETIAGAIERGGEALLLHRFQEIVNRVQLERLDREVVVRRHERHQRKRRPGDATDNVEAAQFGHLQIEERQMRTLGFDERQCLLAPGRLSDEQGARARLEQPRQERRAGRSSSATTMRRRWHHACRLRAATVAFSSSGSPSAAAARRSWHPSRLSSERARPRCRSNAAAAVRRFEGPHRHPAEDAVRPAARPYSRTTIRLATWPSPCRRALTLTTPPFSAPAMPCFTAFSTSGWTISEGTGVSASSDGMSRWTSSRSSNRSCSIPGDSRR